MNRRVSRPAIIGALLRKELLAYSRDLVYLALTIFLLVLIPVLFRFLPDSVDETITLGISPSLDTLVADARADLEAGGATPEQLAALDELDLSEEGLALVEVDDAAQLAGVVEGRLEAWRTETGDVVVRDPASEPEPDVAICRGALRDYLDRHPGPAEVAIVVEVAEELIRFGMGDLAPKRERNKHDRSERELNDRHKAISTVPISILLQKVRHNQRTDGCANAPEAV